MEKEVLRFVEEIFVKMGESPVIENSKKFGTFYINVKNLSDKGLFIGRDGSILKAFQFIVNVYAHKLDRNFPTITLDIDGYKAKHFEKLKTIALDAALKAKRLREPVELRPMSSQARRIIHLTLKNYPDIWTHSVGKEPRRRVIVDIKK
ncbi:MAG: KH domain-containing protein [Candidatus Atribacteria bacterium]|nr:KH domain-containing protein [Candidatus Atribacteria bacterium]